MFLAHLFLGLLIVVPFAVFVILHFVAARHRRNRLALRTGYALGGASLALLVTGLILVRFGWFEIRDPRSRAVAYWLHAMLPLAAASLYVWHRRRGGRFRAGRAWASFAAVAALSVALAVVHALNPSPKSGVPHEGERFFSPSLVRTQEGRLLPLTRLDDERVLQEVSRRRLRRMAPQRAPVQLVQQPGLPRQRPGNAQGRAAARRRRARQPLVRRLPRPGAVLRAARSTPRRLDEPIEPTGQAGITCTVCHAITTVNSTRGNADYTIEEPLHYPFAFSDNPFLQ